MLRYEKMLNPSHRELKHKLSNFINSETFESLFTLSVNTNFFLFKTYHYIATLSSFIVLQMAKVCHP